MTIRAKGVSRKLFPRKEKKRGRGRELKGGDAIFLGGGAPSVNR